ncbi:unnamed protein product [Mycena citricolor]|uniref:Uncharacterized protein n=1 Tax=Mycena citricolor TaxID=2018698 RepID=A0AAD2H752_9AGAR|nr:unnamed protein product [Mycena citricolor]
MPRLYDARLCNDAIRIDYDDPVTVIVGGTEGVGRALAGKMRRRLGRGRVLVLGPPCAPTVPSRYESDTESTTSKKAITDSDGHSSMIKPGLETDIEVEYVAYDASDLSNVREVCDRLVATLGKINFLVLTASTASRKGKEKEGTKARFEQDLVINYFSHFLCVSILINLVSAARRRNEDAQVLTVSGAAQKHVIPEEDFQFVRARQQYAEKIHRAHEEGRRTLPFLMDYQGMLIAATYNQVLVAWFAAKYPDIAFTYMYPESTIVATRLQSLILLLLPRRVQNRIIQTISHPVNLDDSAELVLYALMDSSRRGLFFRNKWGDLDSRFTFPRVKSGETAFEASMARDLGNILGQQMPGYSGSDFCVVKLVAYTESFLNKRLQT